MKLPFYIARRYLLAKKSHNLINFITWISIISVSVAAFAMIFVLSVFNGFSVVISDMIHQLSPDLDIRAEKGKTIDLKTFPLEDLKKINGVDFVFPVVIEDALFKNHNKQQIGQIKGVPEEYNRISRIRGSILNDSTFTLHDGKIDFGVPGAGMAYFLGINIYQPYSMIQVYVPKHGNASSFSIENSFNSDRLLVDKIFSTQQEIDEKLVLAPFGWLSDLLEYDSLTTNVEVFTNQKADLKKIKKKMKTILGDDFKILNQYEQQETLYKMMRAEKFAVYLILTFILIMTTFNVVGSLSMLIIDKKKDITVMKSMGADKILIRNIFMNEGILISVVGGILGLILGIIAVLLQQEFGFIRLGNGSGNYVIDAYPVALYIADILLVLVTIVIIGGTAAFFTVYKSINKMEDVSLNTR